MDNIRVVKETILAVGKKSFFLVLPFLGSISLLTKTKLKKSLKFKLYLKIRPDWETTFI